MRKELKEQIAQLAGLTKQAETNPNNAPAIPPSPTPNTSAEANIAEMTGFLSQEIAALLSAQLGNEMYSAYAYYAIGGWCKNQGLDGFMAYCHTQAKGELEHFNKVQDYLLESGQKFELPALQAPCIEYNGIKEAIESVLKLEKAVTMDWRKIHVQAGRDMDAATTALAQWFVTEQMEEEDLAYTLLQRINLAGSGDGIITMDAQLMEKYK